MRNYELIIDGYIVAIGIGKGGEEISKNKYDNILHVIHNKPQPESGFDYKLKPDLTWELYELPRCLPKNMTKKQQPRTTKRHLQNWG